MMKAAILGTGFIAGFHADAYSRLDGVRLCAVCDTDEKRAADMAGQYRCAAYTNASTLLKAEKPDLVSVCLPTFLHAQYTTAALESGAHVLCEKPMALTERDCEAMRLASEKTGRLLMIGQVLRWWPEYVRIRQIREELGRPRYLRAMRLQHASRGGWFMRPDQGGGALFDLFVHDLDYVCWLMDDVPQLESVNGHRGSEGSWRRISASFKWDGGTYAHVEACNCLPAGYPFSASFHMEYENSALDYTFRAPLNIQKDAPVQADFLLFGPGGPSRLPTVPDAQSQAFRAEIAAFAQGALTGVSPAPVMDNVRIMRLIQTIRETLEAS